MGRTIQTLEESEAGNRGGFMPARRSPRRLIANIQGMPKTGKTALALTAQKPIGYIGIEIGGEEGLIDKYIPSGKDSTSDIFVAPIRMDSPQYHWWSPSRWECTCQ